jgi:hypothetical protein
MKTIKYKDIDGFRIVVGSGSLATDPVESKKLADNEVLKIANDGFKKLPELKQQLDLGAKKRMHSAKAFQAMGKAKILRGAALGALQKKELKTAEKFTAEQQKLEQESQQELGAAEITNRDLIAVKQKLEPKLRVIRKKNLAYCEPGANQLIDRATADLVMCKPTDEMSDVLLPDGVTVGDLLDAFQAKTDNQQICVDGSIVADCRGEWYHKDNDGNWIVNVIEKIGVSPNEGDILKEDLTAEQQEEIRLQNLTSEQHEAEKQMLIDSALSQAANMKAKLEIQNDADALKKSQDWYAQRVTEIESKYV